MTPTPDKTFALVEALDLFRKLQWEWDQLRSFDITEAALAKQYVALNAAMTAWHLTDWFCARMEKQHYARLSIEVGEAIDNCAVFKRWVLRQRNISICEQIAVSTKHYRIDRREHVVATDRREFPLANGLVTHYLMVEDHNSLQPIETVIGFAIAFWRTIFVMTGLATEEDVAPT
jgi:hypothetical protein